MVHLFKKMIELGLLVSGISTVWEDTNGCANQYMCALSIYIMTVLSYLWLIPVFWGRYLDTDPYFVQYWHFFGTIVDVHTDINPYTGVPWTISDIDTVHAIGYI